MKSILLASVSAFAFAGAAAADVSMSGSADAHYNSVFGTGGSASLKFSASTEFDSGWTATTSFSLAYDDFGFDSFDAQANVSLTDGTSTIEFGKLTSAVYDIMGAKVSANQSTVWSKDKNWGAKATTTVGDFKVAANVWDGSGYSIAGSGSFGDMDVALGTANGSPIAVKFGGTFGGADVSVMAFDTGAWGAKVSYTAGDLTVAVDTGDLGGYNVAVDYAAGDFTVGLTTDEAFDWALTLGYEAGAVSMSASTDAGGNSGVDISYDMGNSISLFAGTRVGTDAESYAAVEYSLSDSASMYVSFSTTGAGYGQDTYAKEYMVGGTVGVSFEF